MNKNPRNEPEFIEINIGSYLLRTILYIFVLVILQLQWCRFSADGGQSPVSTVRALHQKATEARVTGTPKPSDSEMAGGRTIEQPPDAESSAQKALSSVPTKLTSSCTHCTVVYTQFLNMRAHKE